MQRCSICNASFEGYGHNPAPIGDANADRCCDMCNDLVVIPARIARIRRMETLRRVTASIHKQATALQQKEPKS